MPSEHPSYSLTDSMTLSRIERAARGFVFNALISQIHSRRFAPDSKPIDSVPPIYLLICRDGEASGKDRLDRAATDCAAAALAASARAGVAARRMGRARAQSDSSRRHLRVRLIRCARRA